MAEHGITQVALARRIGYPDSFYLNRWLTGKRTPQLKSMLIVDEALQELVEGR